MQHRLGDDRLFEPTAGSLPKSHDEVTSPYIVRHVPETKYLRISSIFCSGVTASRSSICSGTKIFGRESGVLY